MADVIVNSLAPSTIKQYAGYLKKWKDFADRNKLDIFNPSENDLYSFLVEMLKDGAAFGTINTAKAAVTSIIIKPFDADSKVGSKFMNGLYRLKPTKPRYEETWDVTPVLEKLGSLFPLESLNLAELSNKLVLLLAIGSAQRLQTLASIKISNVIRTEIGLEIRITDMIKTSRIGASQPVIKLPYFVIKKGLCIASTLDYYIKVTSSLRGDIDDLFITSRKPYKKASKDTLSRWIRSSLVKFGIDPKFKPHSTRHASTSSALKKGISLDRIKSAAGWSENSKVFFQFYNRPINDGSNEFAVNLIDHNDL